MDKLKEKFLKAATRMRTWYRENLRLFRRIWESARKLVLYKITANQCCGSGLVESRSLYGSESGISSEFGSRVLMINLKKKKTAELFFFLFLIKKCNLLVPWLPQRTSKLLEKLSALKREQPALQKMNFLKWFLSDSYPAFFLPIATTSNKKFY